MTCIIGSCAIFNFSYCLWISYTSDPLWTKISTNSSIYCILCFQMSHSACSRLRGQRGLAWRFFSSSCSVKYTTPHYRWEILTFLLYTACMSVTWHLAFRSRSSGILWWKNKYKLTRDTEYSVVLQDTHSTRFHNVEYCTDRIDSFITLWERSVYQLCQMSNRWPWGAERPDMTPA